MRLVGRLAVAPDPGELQMLDDGLGHQTVLVMARRPRPTWQELPRLHEPHLHVEDELFCGDWPVFGLHASNLSRERSENKWRRPRHAASLRSMCGRMTQRHTWAEIYEYRNHEQRMKHAAVTVKEHDIVVTDNADLGTRLEKGGTKGRRVNRSLREAAAGEYPEMLDCQGEKRGKLSVRADPAGTTEQCIACGSRETKANAAWVTCTACGERTRRDAAGGSEPRDEMDRPGGSA